MGQFQPGNEAVEVGSSGTHRQPGDLGQTPPGIEHARGECDLTQRWQACGDQAVERGKVDRRALDGQCVAIAVQRVCQGAGDGKPRARRFQHPLHRPGGRRGRVEQARKRTGVDRQRELLPGIGPAGREHDRGLQAVGDRFEHMQVEPLRRRRTLPCQVTRASSMRRARTSTSGTDPGGAADCAGATAAGRPPKRQFGRPAVSRSSRISGRISRRRAISIRPASSGSTASSASAWATVIM